MKYKIGDKLEPIAQAYTALRTRYNIADRLKIAEGLTNLEKDIIAILLDQVTRAVNEGAQITFSGFPRIEEHIHPPQQNALYNNALFLEYLTGSLRDFVVRPKKLEREVIGKVIDFSDDVYMQLHDILPQRISDADATAVARSFYNWHIRPSLAVGEIILENEKDHPDSNFERDFHVFSTTYDTIEQRLTRSHPYNLIDNQITNLFQRSPKGYIDENYAPEQKSLKRAVLVNLYAGAQFLHYVAHVQTMNEAPKKSPSNGDALMKAFREALAKTGSQ